jgi:competence protein ComEC
MLLVFLITSWPSSIHKAIRPTSATGILIFNVGQGQWATAIEKDLCFHFDSGGETIPKKDLLIHFCGEKLNVLFISHLDWDHISFLKWHKRLGLKTCRFESDPKAKLPFANRNDFEEKDLSQKKQATLKHLRNCDEVLNLRQKNLFQSYLNQYLSLRWKPNQNQSLKSSNDKSQVLGWEDFLVPGDSTMKAERIWSREFKLQHFKYLLLGHHGSQSSTSEALLKRLTSLKLAIASARFAKYGHPHRKVKERLKNHGVSLISTEQWGTVFIEEK